MRRFDLWSLHHKRQPRHGFTLVEMLIAMAVTLILVTALATGFAFVGQNIRDGRGEVQLSNQLRDATERMSEELSSMTVSLQPNSGESDQLGYFLYYEGPMTDATSSLFAAELVDGEVALSHSRYGDFDDYIAFTAVATGDKWFTGKVPRFLLDQKTAELNNPNLAAGVDPYNSASFDGNPWEPVVIRSKYAEIIYFASPEYDRSALLANPASPIYIDPLGTGLPDRLRLHRRVLLIRPDLNLKHGSLRMPGWDREFGSGVEFMLADAWPAAAAATVRPEASPADAWLYGMAAVHQQCDLSVRRVLGSNGLPTQQVAANSLEDLSKPHNRFAHVRVPGNLLGLNSNVTSMPVLALGPPANLLSVVAAGGGPVSPPPSATPPGDAVVRPNQLSGFLRPEFVLGQDFSHRNSNADAWGLERVGEDLIANNALSFDVKVFDSQAVSITTSSGMLVGTNDAGFREALREYTTARPIMHGDFVDLAYPVLAGGALRGWNSVYLDRLQASTTPAISPTVAGLLTTPFSGIVGFGNRQNSYLPSLYRSGKILTDGSAIRLFQPTFDTYTSAYEVDGFVQGYVRSGSPVASGDVGGGGVGTRWTASNAANLVDVGSNGLDDNGFYGADDEAERETLAPFPARVPAVRVTIRLENRDNRQLKQISVVHRDRG